MVQSPRPLTPLTSFLPPPSPSSPVGHFFLILHLSVSLWDGQSNAAFSSDVLLPPRVLVRFPHLKPQVTPSRRHTLHSLHSASGARRQSSERGEDQRADTSWLQISQLQTQTKTQTFLIWFLQKQILQEKTILEESSPVEAKNLIRLRCGGSRTREVFLKMITERESSSGMLRSRPREVESAWMKCLTINIAYLNQ